MLTRTSSVAPTSFPSLEERPSKVFPLPIREKKKKTRPSEGSADQSETVSADSTVPSGGLQSGLSSELQRSEPRVLVKHENLKLLTQMYTSDNGKTRSFSWKHFVQAMADAGFSVTQGSGSAVSFKNDAGTIAFHQPHPDPTIDPVMLSSMGKRMRKWFGWDAEAFGVRPTEVKMGE